MRDAVRWNKLTKSPADAADPPRSASADHEMRVWSASELRAFLTAERGSRFYALWLTLATTGMRRGEVLGLRWEDIDLEAQTISIRQTRVMTGYEPLLSTPKTRRGKRLVALDPATAAALKEHRRHQWQERLAAGSSWQKAGYLFTRDDGEPYHPERVSKLFIQASKRAGLPRIRLHDLRHTYATLALGAGVHPKIVSERLGHANIGITLDTYSHCLPVLSEEAACRVAALVLAD
jgi:integrase